MRSSANPQGRSEAEECGGAIICSEAAARSRRSRRGNKREAALLRGAAPAQVKSPVAGMARRQVGEDDSLLEWTALRGIGEKTRDRVPLRIHHSLVALIYRLAAVLF